MKETFSLTAINEVVYKEPSLPRLTTAPQLSRAHSMKKSTEIKSLLSSIRQSSRQSITEIAKRDPSELVSIISKLEGTAVVKEALESLNMHVIQKKKHYNSLSKQKLGLQEEIVHLQQILQDLSARSEDHSFAISKLTHLQEKSEEIQAKITTEKRYAENLKHMIATRKDMILQTSKPIREMRKEMREVETKHGFLQKITENNQKSLRIHRSELMELQEKVNNHREGVRDQLNKELKVFQDRATALAFYEESQKIWHAKRKAAHKDTQIRELQRQQKNLSHKETLLAELSKAQVELNNKENSVKLALQATNVSSLAELGSSIQKLKDSKAGLVKSEAEIEQRLERHAKQTATLNKELETLLVEKQSKDTKDCRDMYQLEEQVILKERENQAFSAKIQYARTQAASIVLSMNRLIQYVGDKSGDSTVRGIQEALKYLKAKISEKYARNSLVS